MTHCSNKQAHTPNNVLREIPYWGLSGQNATLGPIRSSEILVPCPWPETLRIPGQTLPIAGRCRRIKLTQCGPLGLLDTEPVPGLRELRPYFPAAGPPAEPKAAVRPPTSKPPKTKIPKHEPEPGAARTSTVEENPNVLTEDTPKTTDKVKGKETVKGKEKGNDKKKEKKKGAGVKKRSSK